jgi:hypothetical protein
LKTKGKKRPERRRGQGKSESTSQLSNLPACVDQPSALSN